MNISHVLACLEIGAIKGESWQYTCSAWSNLFSIYQESGINYTDCDGYARECTSKDYEDWRAMGDVFEPMHEKHFESTKAWLTSVLTETAQKPEISNTSDWAAKFMGSNNYRILNNKEHK
jgi:hypothetical protein